MSGIGVGRKRGGALRETVVRRGPHRGLESLQGSLGEAPWVSVL